MKLGFLSIQALSVALCIISMTLYPKKQTIGNKIKNKSPSIINTSAFEYLYLYYLNFDLNFVTPY